MPIVLDGTANTVTPLTASGVATFTAGSAAAPAITTAGDTNTGIFFPAADTIAFAEGGAEAMRIDSSGNLGIGGTPSAWGGGYLGLQVGRAAIMGRVGGENAFFIGNAYYDGTSYKYTTSGNAEMYTVNAGTHSWLTAASGTAGNAITWTTPMTLDASGNLLVGKTTAGTGGGNGIQISKTNMTYVCSESSGGSGCYEFYSSNIGAYRFYVTSTGTVFATNTTITAISDQRLKENVRDLDCGLNKILALQPRRFDWKEGKGLDKKDDVGFIAQEFETVFPQSVVGSKAGEDGIEYKALNHSELIPTLVKAIQEQQALITSLTARLEVLEAK